MTETPRGSEAVLSKVVLVGPAGSGKAGILKAVAEQYARAPVRATEVGEGQVFRTRFFWPKPLADGRSLEVRLFAVSGSPSYNAVSELTLTAAEGIVFAASLRRADAAAAKAALQALVFNAGQQGLSLGALPVVIQLHDPGDGSAMEPAELLQILEIKEGAVPCCVTGRRSSPSIRTAVEWIVAEIARRADTPREAIPH